MLVDRKGEVGGSSGEAGLEGEARLEGEAGLESFFEGEEIGERKVTTKLLGRSKPEGVRGWKSPSGSEGSERQSSQGGKIEFNAAYKMKCNKFKQEKLVLKSE